MRALMGVGAMLAGSVAVGACAEGREPPAVTPMVEIRSDLVFTFGPETWCTAPGKVAPNCTTDVTFPVLWPRVKVQLAPFAIDAHEVTNLQYAYCIAAGGCHEDDLEHAANASQGYKSYYGNPQFDDYPVVQVTWDLAKEYCEFVHKRLPTQAEWERVATGGDSKHRLFPVEDATVDSFAACNAKGIATFFCSNSYDLQPAGVSEEDYVVENGQRIYQLMGNVAEWTADTHDTEGDITCKAPPPSPCKRESECGGNIDCQQAAHSCPACAGQEDPCYYLCDTSAAPDPHETIVCTAYPEDEQPILASKLQATTSGARVVRGGSATLQSNAAACEMTSTYRDKLQDPGTASPTTGFRCAKTLDN